MTETLFMIYSAAAAAVDWMVAAVTSRALPRTRRKCVIPVASVRLHWLPSSSAARRGARR